jgi:hypothetical protein
MGRTFGYVFINTKLTLDECEDALDKDFNETSNPVYGGQHHIAITGLFNHKKLVAIVSQYIKKVEGAVHSFDWEMYDDYVDLLRAYTEILRSDDWSDNKYVYIDFK